jgi:predicted transcriptional regulator
LIAIPVTKDGQEMTCYFADEAAAEAAFAADSMRAALRAIGSCSDLDWDDMVEALDRIRHESHPTPPLELDEPSEHD